MLVGNFLVLMLEVKAGLTVSKSEVKRRTDKQNPVNKTVKSGSS